MFSFSLHPTISVAIDSFVILRYSLSLKGDDLAVYLVLAVNKYIDGDEVIWLIDQVMDQLRI